MANGRIYNFSAGPSMLPLEVLERAGKEITNYQGSGMSVMEMSHRSKVFQKIFDDTKAKFKKLMAVPDDYEVLFLQGGASTQFSAIPLNLIGSSGKADYAVTGNFSNLAYQEAKKYGDIAVACTSEDQDFSYIPTQDKIVVRPDASYFYYCANNTIYGTEWQYIPETGNVPIVCDMSSDICSRQVDVSRYGVIYAGAQKNLAPAGVTIVIVKKELAGHELPITPKMLGWQIEIEETTCPEIPAQEEYEWDIDRESVTFPLVLRARQQGDQLRLPGRRTKTLKKWFIDEKIPRQHRQSVPVLADETGLLAAAGLGPNFPRVATPGHPALHIRLTPKQREENELV